MIQKKKKILLKIKKTTIFKTRKVSFYESPKKTVFGTLDFEIPEKNELLENKDNIYKDLKPKAFVKNSKG